MKPLATSPQFQRRRRQGQLLAFGMTGAMALALSACDNASGSGETMLVPPTNFNPAKAVDYSSTNQPPQSPEVFAHSNCSGYLCGHGYFPVYGYPGYYYEPAPGSSIELVRGGSRTYVADSPEEARENVARGGFGGEGEHGGEGGEGGHGGGE